ncbi:RNA polymerase-associated protein RapA [Legionella fallonii]|nr:RNA polymerase-associated protein RapA [Legionella fallonii]
MTFTIGQRWISNTESQLGLGIITELQGRQIGISFPAAGEERIYAIDNAPLSRIIYKEGEEVITNEQKKLRIAHVHEHQGIIIYSCMDEEENEVQITELALNCFIKLSTPEQRLFSGLLDKLNAFKLRIETLHHVSRLQQSNVRGLLGSRTSHLPHQVYIASEVAQRYAPRVLLADEVGLGKTIEAGMILHYQLHTGRAKRILIVVPDTLIHQWLVEMIRRFNLYFSIFDQKRYDLMQDAMDYCDDEEQEEDFIKLLETPTENNLFETEQLVLCSLDFLMANEKAREQATTCQWDIVIVDEAHHLHWSEEEKSPEYSCVEQLATQSKGLLLLTATPEQVGIESHFARLRLLDPSRFYDFAEFKKQEQQYQEINKIVQKLVQYRDENQTNELNDELRAELNHYLPEQSSTNINDTIKNLLDRHGTGRVLFRNTRAAIHGFPERHLNVYPLPCPAPYTQLTEQSGTIHLYPETTTEKNSWLEQDPRVEWLATHLKALYPQKVLVICAKAQTAIALEQYLKLKKGIRSTAFHERLSIIDRDRAAAYFSEEENGAQTLVCSEIGSEGRNFQFSHHLVLFDLPLNPDLLEQRIGRLDRIGQQHTIEIHVPYLLNTAQELLFRWYHEGINLFEKSCSVGFSIYETFAERLLPILEHPQAEENQTKLEALITDTKIHAEKINEALQEGRDKLLEMNSCNPVKAKELITDIEAEENYLELENYMAKVFHEYAIDHEYHSEYSEILRPTEHMKTSHFPGLKEDGVTVTYSRAKALIREDMEFLSWEHPMVNESIEMILSSEVGNATLTTISIKNIPPGTLFLETFYTINCPAPKELQLDRFLPFTPIRILMDVSGKNLSKILSYTQLNEMCESVKRHLGYPIVKQVHEDLEKILDRSNQVAEVQMREIIDGAHSAMKDSIGNEINRLEALQKINPSIRDEEIAFFKRQIVESEHHINSATLKLQALRVVINK